MNADTIVDILKKVGDPTRLHLLLLCRRCDLSVSELTWIMEQSQPRISRHLKLLCDAGMLEKFPEGNWVIYRHAVDGGGQEMADLVDDLIDHDQAPTSDILVRLDQVRARRQANSQAYFSKNATRWAEISRLQVSERDVETALHGVLGGQAIGDMLDLGTGTGRLLTILGGRARRAIGVDLNGEMLSLARHALDRPDMRHIQVRQGNVEALPFGDASFDLITAHQLLHFIDRPEIVIAEAARLLRPGGRLVIADLLPHQMDSLMIEQSHRRAGFDTDEVVRWLDANGLRLNNSLQLTGRPLPVGIWAAVKPQIERPEGAKGETA